MNVLLAQPPIFPHQHENNRHSPSRGMSPFSSMTSQATKRKRDDDGDEMSVSPTPAQRQLARPRKMQKMPETPSRTLPLHRLLETLDVNQLRSVLQTICERRTDIQEEVLSGAPRPTAANSLQVLHSYQQKLAEATPLGHTTSDYAYYRVKQPLAALVNAIMDFTPQYLPPMETQTNLSLVYLDGVTKIAHSMPHWDSEAYRHHKNHVYDELAKAWTMVISEAAKRGGGFTLHTEGWDQVLADHSEHAGGRLQPAINVLADHVGWMNSNQGQNESEGGSSGQHTFLNQLLNGTYGSSVRVGQF